jgi:transposase-like protein
MKTEIKFNNLLDVVNRFPNEQSCRDFLEQMRWNGKPVCPRCGYSEKIYRIQGGKLLKCASCRQPFSVKIGTIFEDSALPLQKWFYAFFIFSSHKKGISSCQLARDISVTQKTAWHMLHRIRLAMKTKSFEKPLDGIVEADETFVGGKKRGRNKTGYPNDKTPVFGMVQRQGEVRTMPIANVKADTIKPIIRNNVSFDSVLMTDNYNGYKGLDKEFKEHNIISHSTHQYVNGIIHTNTIEGFWSLLKRGIFGIYHHVSPEHLSRYCEEFEYRYNTRKLTETDRFALTLAQCAGRLTYKSLAGKV